MQCGCVAGSRTPQIFVHIGPKPAPSRIHDDDGAVRYPAIAQLPGTEIFHPEAIIRLLRTGNPYIDDDRRADQTVERNVIDRRLALGEVYGSIDMGTSVF